MFHHLAPSVERELKGRLADEARGEPPRAELSGLINLGRGVAYRVRSPELEVIRKRIAEAFHALLTPQDRGAWRPHVTVQNKVDPADARRLLRQLEAGFVPGPLSIVGLAAYAYRGGPWELLASYRFRAR